MKEIHPFAEIFPQTSESDFLKLKESINENGQRDPIVLLGGKILDGRHRYKACSELGIAPQFRNFDPERDGSPIKYVSDTNLTRRHLTVGQKSAIAAQIEELIKQEEEEEAKKKAAVKDEEPKKETVALEEKPKTKKKEPKPAKTGDDRPHRKREAEAASMAGASPRSLRDFKFVEKWAPEAAAKVTSGEMSINAAKDIATDAKNAASKYRKEASDILEGSHGKEFSDLVREAKILETESELKKFSRLEISDQRRIKNLVVEGWRVDQAIDFAKGEFAPDQKIETLISFYRANAPDGLDEAGWASAYVGGYVIAISKSNSTESEA